MNIKKFLALLTASAMTLSILTGCTDKKSGGADSTSAETSSESGISSIATIPMLPEIQEADTLHRTEIISITANKTTGKLIEPDTDFSIVTKQDIDPAQLKNLIGISPAVGFEVNKTSACNYTLKTTEPLTENRMTVISLMNGDGDTEYKWAFQINGAFRISETYPSDGSDYNAVNTGIELKFTANVNAEDAEHYIEFVPPIDGKFQSHRSTLYFIPSRDLKEGTKYNVRVKAGLKSADGAEMKDDFFFSFETSESRYNYFYSDGISETFIKGDLPLIPVYCSDDAKDLSYSVELYRYDGADKYYSAMTECLNSGESLSKYKFPTDGLNLIYKEKLSLMKNEQDSFGWGPSYILLPENLDEGYYIANVTGDGGHGYGLQRMIQISSISVYSAYVGNESQFFINDVNTGEAVSGAEISLMNGEKMFTGVTRNDGVATLATDYENTNTTILKVRCGDRVYCDFYNSNGSAEAEEYRIHQNYYSYVYTDRQIYQTSDTVKIWGFVRPRKKGAVLPDNLSLRLGSYDSGDGCIDIPFEIKSDGTFSAEVSYTDLKYKWGTSIGLYCGDERMTSTYIRIQDYVKPKFNIETTFPPYVVFPQENSFTVEVDTSLFDGTAADGLTFEVSGYNVKSASPSQITTESNGHAESQILFKDHDKWRPYSNSVDISLTGVQNEYQQSYTNIPGFYRDVMLEYDYDAEKHSLTLNTSKIVVDDRVLDIDLEYDYDSEELMDIIRGNPADVSIDCKLIRTYYTKTESGSYYDFLLKKTVKIYDYTRHEETVGTYNVKTVNGVAVIDNLPTTDRESSYRFELEWKDTQGRTTTESIYLSNYYYYYDNQENSEAYYTFSVDSAEFTENQELTFTLMNNFKECPDAEGRILLQACNTGFINHQVYDSATFTHTMTKDYIPNVNIIGAYFDGRHIFPIYNTNSYTFNPEEREILLEISPDKQNYAPGESVSVTVTAKDTDGKPVANASVLLSVVDEAAFAVANQIADPLGDIYSYIYFPSAGQYHSYVQHVLGTNSAGEMGGGGGDSSVRRDFKDTAAFMTGTTDGNGHAQFTLNLPDNITEWRATAVAMHEESADRVLAGASRAPIICTQPIFVEPVMLSEIIEGDDLTVSARCYGEASGNEEITVTITGNGINQTQTAPSGSQINFGSLPAGNYTVTFSAGNGTNSDKVELPLTVTDTLLESNITTDFLLADGTKLTPTKWPLHITFYDEAHMLYTDTLYKLLLRAGDRLDMRIASAFARSEFGFITEEDYIRNFSGITSTGLATLMNASEPSVALTAKICAAAPELVDKPAVIRKMYSVLDSEDSTPEEISSAYLALAALGEPVMTEIRGALETSTFSENVRSDSFCTEDGLRLIAALALLGDYDNAIKHYKVFTEDIVISGNDGEQTAYINGTDSLSLTQTAIMSAAVLRQPEADMMARYLIGNVQTYDSFALELMLYLKNYVPSVEGDAVFTYNIGGETRTVTLDRHFGTHISFMEEDYKHADFKVTSGSVYAVAEYIGHPEQNDSAPTLTVQKTITSDTGTMEPGSLVTVKITVKGGDKHFYTVYDVIPSCGRYADSEQYVYRNGQQLELYTGNSGVATYQFRIASSGNYVLESASATDWDGGWGVSERSALTVEDND